MGAGCELRGGECRVTTLTAHFDVPPGKRAPSSARAVVDTVLLSWGLDDANWRDETALIVSELVTNAVCHGGGEITLEIVADGPGVCVVVTDGSAAPPRRREPDDTGGRGLIVIEALAARWQVHSHGSGKRVRVDLHPHPESGRPRQPAPLTPSDLP
jgi:anti-sigma regulatory factor (Ser/Thr protein kinase)